MGSICMAIITIIMDMDMITSMIMAMRLDMFMDRGTMGTIDNAYGS